MSPLDFSVRRPSPPNTYSYVREENLGSMRKFVEIYLWYCFTNLILAIHTQSVNGLEEPFQDSGEKFLQHGQLGTSLAFPPPFFSGVLSTVLRALRELMYGGGNSPLPGLRASSQNIIWSTTKVNEACACMVLGPHTSCGKS